MSVDNQQTRLDAMGEKEGSYESHDRKVALGQENERQTRLLTEAYIDRTDRILREIESPDISDEMRARMTSNMEEFLKLLGEKKDVKKKKDDYLRMLDEMMDEIEEVKNTREFFQKEIFDGILEPLNIANQLDIDQLATAFLARDEARRCPLELMADNLRRLLEVQALSVYAPQIILDSKAEIFLAIGCFINGYQSEGETKIQNIVRKIEMSHEAEDLDSEIAQQEIVINESSAKYMNSCLELKKFFESPPDQQTTEVLLRLYEKQAAGMCLYVNSMEGVVSLGEEFVFKDPAFKEERRVVFAETINSRNLAFMNVILSADKVPNTAKTIASFGLAGAAAPEAREAPDFVTEVFVGVKRLPFPLDREGFDLLKSKMEDALLAARRNIFVETADENYRQYFEESQRRSLTRLTTESDAAIDLAQQADKLEVDEEKLRPELYQAAKTKAASFAQTVKTVCDLQVTDPMAAYKKGLALRSELNWWSGKLGLDVVAARTTEGLTAVFLNMRVKDVSPVVFVKGLAQAPKLKIFFGGIVQTYAQMVDGLLPDIFNKNPIITQFKKDFRELKQGSLPFIGSVQNLVQMVNKGETPTAHFVETFVHPDAQRVLANPLIDELQASPVIGWLQELGVMGVSGDVTAGVLGVEESDVGGGMGEAISSGISLNVADMCLFMQRLRDTAGEALKISGERMGIGGFSIDGLIYAGELLLAVAGAIAVTAAFPAAGFVGLTVASGFGSTFGSAVGSFVFENDVTGFKPVNFLQNWALGSFFTGAAGISGRLLGTAAGEARALLAERVEQALLKSDSAFGKAIFGFLKRQSDRVMDRYAARLLAGEAEHGNIFKHILTEYREEVMEDVCEAIGRGMSSNDPVMGFLFMLIPSTTSTARHHFAMKKGVFSPVQGVVLHLSEAGEILQYDPEKRAEVRVYLEERGAPTEVLMQFDEGGAVDFQHGGVRLLVQPNEALDIGQFFEGSDSLNLVYHEEAGIYECKSEELEDFVHFVESNGYMLVKVGEGEFLVRGIQNVKGVRVVVSTEETAGHVFEDATLSRERTFFEERAKRDLERSDEFFEKREKMAQVLAKAKEVESSDWTLLGLEKGKGEVFERIFQHMTDGLELSAGQLALVRNRLLQIKKDLKFAEKARAAVGNEEAEVAFVNKIFDQEAKGGRVEGKVEIQVGTGIVPSSVFVILDDVDFFRLLEKEQRSWNKLSEAERKQLQSPIAGFNIGRLSFVRRSFSESNPKVFRDIVRHEETHYLNNLFSLRQDYIDIVSFAWTIQSRGDYQGALYRYFDGEVVKAHNEITAYLNDETTWSKANVVTALTRLDGSLYVDKLKFIRGQIEKSDTLDEADKKVLLAEWEAHYRRYKLIVTQSVELASQISQYPGGYDLLMVTPIRRWAELFDRLKRAHLNIQHDLMIAAERADVERIQAALSKSEEGITFFEAELAEMREGHFNEFNRNFAIGSFVRLDSSISGIPESGVYGKIIKETEKGYVVRVLFEDDQRDFSVTKDQLYSMNPEREVGDIEALEVRGSTYALDIFKARKAKAQQALERAQKRLDELLNRGEIAKSTTEIESKGGYRVGDFVRFYDSYGHPVDLLVSRVKEGHEHPDFGDLYRREDVIFAVNEGNGRYVDSSEFMMQRLVGDEFFDGKIEMATLLVKLQTLPIETWELYQIERDPVVAADRALHDIIDSQGISLSAEEEAFVRSKTAQFTLDVSFAIKARAIQRAGSFERKQFADNLLDDTGEWKLDHDVEIRVGSGGVSSSVVIVMSDSDYLRYAGEENAPWTSLSASRRVELKRMKLGKAIMTKPNGRHVLLMKRSMAQDFEQYEAASVKYGMRYMIDIFGDGEIFDEDLENANRALREAQRNGPFLIERTYISMQALETKQAIIAELSNPDILKKPQLLIDRLTMFGGGYMENLKIYLDWVQENRDMDEYKYKLEYLLSEHVDRVANAVTAAVKILKNPGGWQMLIVTPMEHWVNLVEYLEAKGGSG